MAVWDALSWAGVNDDPGTLPWTRLTSASAWRRRKEAWMATARRVKRLRDLVAQIELLPDSPDRERLLSEFRSRVVDVDTGVTPRAMLPVRESAPVLRRPPERDRAPSITRLAPPPPAPAVELARPASVAGRSKNVEEPFWVDERLSLEDSLRLSSLAPVRTRGDRAVPSWMLGLRG